MEMTVYAAEPGYDREHGPVVHLFGRDADNVARHMVVTGMRPYAYIETDEIREHGLVESITEYEDKPYVAIRGEDVTKVFCTSTKEVRALKDEYDRTFEADVNLPTRFLIDYGIIGGISAPSSVTPVTGVAPSSIRATPRVCIIDIECEDEKGFPIPGRDKITAFTCWDSYTEKYTLFYLWEPNTPFTMEGAKALRAGWAEDDPTVEIKVFQTETDMLTGLVAYLHENDPDVLTGWNFTDFDMPYIQQRMVAIGLQPEALGRIPGFISKRFDTCMGRVVFDLMKGYEKLHEGKQPSYRLDYIAEQEIGKNKVRYTGTLCELWRSSPARLLEYNKIDVDLCVELNKKIKIIDFYAELARYVGIPMSRTLSNSQVVDYFILRRSYGMYVLPSKGEAEDGGESFEGATVMDPSSGLSKWVVVFDLTSLYPCIMWSLNASPETKVGPDYKGEVLTAPNGVRFRKDKEGMTRRLMADLMEERDAKKAERNKYKSTDPEYTILDLQQRVVKEIMNSYYGVSGFKNFRLNDQEFGASVTSTGRAVIAHTKAVLENFSDYHGRLEVLITGEDAAKIIETLRNIASLDVIYGDTDSVMVTLPEMPFDDMIKIGFAINAVINSTYDEFAKTTLNADEHWFHIKFEKLYSRFLQTGKKKRYAGKLIWKEGVLFDKTDVTGFETERSDAPKITKEAQKKVINMILDGKEPADIQTYIKGILKAYMKGKYDYDMIGIPGGFSKEFSNYDNQDAHLRGAIYANKYLGGHFGSGSKPKRLYIKTVTRKYPKTDVIAFEYADEVPPEFIVDIDMMIEKSFKGPISRITDALGINWVSLDPTCTTLSDYGVKA